FVPILPTTPFLLLAGYLFSKSSPRFHSWLLSLPLAGRGIEDWNQRRVIRPRAKILCSVMITASLFSIWLMAPVHLLLKVILTILLVSVMIFVNFQKSR